MAGGLRERQASQTSTRFSDDLDDFEVIEARRDQRANGHHASTSYGLPSIGERRCVSLGGAEEARALERVRRSSEGAAGLRVLEETRRREAQGSKTRKERKKKEYEALSFEQLLAADEADMEGVVEVDSERILSELLGGGERREDRRSDGRPFSWPTPGGRRPGKGGVGVLSDQAGPEQSVQKRSSRVSN